MKVLTFEFMAEMSKTTSNSPYRMTVIVSGYCSVGKKVRSVLLDATSHLFSMTLLSSASLIGTGNRFLMKDLYLGQ